MVRKPEIQYVEDFFVPGSAAPQVQPRRGAKAAPGRRTAPQKPVKRIQLDPVALVGVVVAVSMLILMVVGIFQFNAASQERQQMELYLTHLQDRNMELKYQYHTSYDLAWVEDQARALGMIPAAEAHTVFIQMDIPQPEPEPTLWENICWFVKGLFA